MNTRSNIRRFSVTAAFESLGVPLEERSEAISVALARAIGYKLPIPAQPVESATAYFCENHKDAVLRTLAQINERVVFDLDEVCSTAGAVWLFRYRMAHDPNNDAVRDFLDKMVMVGSSEFPSKVSEYMIRNRDPALMDKLAGAVDSDLVPTDLSSVQEA
jgi:hypothetical protein